MYMEKQIHKICNDFFEKLSVNFSDLSTQQEAPHIFRISLKSDDSNLLIWPHGKNLDTISHILKIIISKHLWEHTQIHVEVNDYLERKDEKLLSFIKTKIDYVKDSGKEIILPFFTAYERKKVHSYVAENGWTVYTQSLGEGKERRIHLCKKDEKMTIDIDGDDI